MQHKRDFNYLADFAQALKIELGDLVEAGKNLIYIRDFLGHESIETTQVYAKANPEARRKALETMDTRMNTPAMPDWNDDPDLKSFLKTL